MQAPFFSVSCEFVVFNIECPHVPARQCAPRYSLRLLTRALLRFVFTIGANLTSSFGHKLHDGCWILKWTVFILMHFASVFVPYTDLINFSYVQSFGSAVFLLVQIVLLIDFCYDAAEWFKKNGFQKANHAGEGGNVKPCWLALMMFSLVACLSAIIAMLVLGFRWFTTPVSNSLSTSDSSCGMLQAYFRLFTWVDSF